MFFFVLLELYRRRRFWVRISPSTAQADIEGNFLTGGGEWLGECISEEGEKYSINFIFDDVLGL